MTNYKEILRLQSLGINNTRIAEACGCACSTVISTLQYANAKGLIEPPNFFPLLRFSKTPVGSESK
ncbi:MAG: hypothetical protein WAU62_11710 [Dehalococcoidales bacterium]|jgi:hypothetical protein